MIISMQLFIFVVNVGTSLHADVLSKWSKFERTLPVKPDDIVKAKYVSFFILFLFGILMGSITAVLAYITSGFSDIQPVLYGYEFGFTLAAVTAGIMYPLMLRIGTEKNEMIMILSAFAAIGLKVLVTVVLSPLIGEMNMRHSLVGSVSTIIALLLFVASYFISVKIYRNKEFA